MGRGAKFKELLTERISVVVKVNYQHECSRKQPSIIISFLSLSWYSTSSMTLFAYNFDPRSFIIEMRYHIAHTRPSRSGCVSVGVVLHAYWTLASAGFSVFQVDQITPCAGRYFGTCCTTWCCFHCSFKLIFYICFLWIYPPEEFGFVNIMQNAASTTVFSSFPTNKNWFLPNKPHKRTDSMCLIIESSIEC